MRLLPSIALLLRMSCIIKEAQNDYVKSKGSSRDWTRRLEEVARSCRGMMEYRKIVCIKNRMGCRTLGSSCKYKSKWV